MDRPGSSAAGTAGRRQTGPREHSPRGGIGVVGDRRVDRPSNRSSEQIDLVNRLRGTNAAKLRGSIGGAHEQRHVGESGLHDRRMEVDGRGSARAEHQCGPTIHRETEGHERGRTLIEHDMTGDSRFGDQREGERGAARAGGDHRDVETPGDPLVDERRAEGGVRGHAPDDTCHAERT